MICTSRSVVGLEDKRFIKFLQQSGGGYVLKPVNYNFISLTFKHL